MTELTRLQVRLLRSLSIREFRKAPVRTAGITICSLCDKGYVKAECHGRTYERYADLDLLLTPCGQRALACDDAESVAKSPDRSAAGSADS